MTKIASQLLVEAPSAAQLLALWKEAQGRPGAGRCASAAVRTSSTTSSSPSASVPSTSTQSELDDARRVIVTIPSPHLWVRARRQGERLIETGHRARG